MRIDNKRSSVLTSTTHEYGSVPLLDVLLNILNKSVCSNISSGLMLSRKIRSLDIISLSQFHFMDKWVYDKYRILSISG